jgi:hypothetical protein
MQVEVRDREIVVRSGEFYAVYYKPAGQPQLILRHRTRTEDQELMAKAWKAASDKARELGWIV